VLLNAYDYVNKLLVGCIIQVIEDKNNCFQSFLLPCWSLCHLLWYFFEFQVKASLTVE